jgi:hypothetical protein
LEKIALMEVVPLQLLFRALYIDDPDPYLNGIKNQAGDKESDEEVLLVTS